MPTTYVIETQALSKTYKNIQALRSLDLKVRQNSIFGFLGPNGAGKTTTIKLMLGLIRPSAGSAIIFGMDSISRSVNTWVGYLPQNLISTNT
jgi:ABC-2 type transport system ATP-binding protein